MDLRIFHYFTLFLSFPFSFKDHRFAFCSLTALLNLEDFIMNTLAKRQCWRLKFTIYLLNNNKRVIPRWIRRSLRAVGSL